MAISQDDIKRVVKLLLAGDDYRIVPFERIQEEFLSLTTGYLTAAFQAKLNTTSNNWYKETFLNEDLKSDEIATNAGLNKKTITNMHNSAKKTVVLNASNTAYSKLGLDIEEAISSANISLNLEMETENHIIRFDTNETLLFITSLAVKRAALRGSKWSAVGKGVEKPLMKTLCALYGVSPANYQVKQLKHSASESFHREVDFYLLNNNEEYKCEVKLMGKGNPESADAAIARGTNIFIADKLSDMNKSQLDSEEINWIELRSDLGFRKFELILKQLGISYEKLDESTLEERINEALGTAFD